MASPTTPLPLLNIPPEFMELIANLNTAVVRWNALADDAKAALNAIKAAADAGTQAVPAIEADAKEMADAAKNLHGTGPLGTKFSTQQ
jgi:thiazole synthase ThiGH ThiG subunit